MEEQSKLRSLPDDELLRRLTELLHQSRCVEADLVAHIGEVDARRLYAREATPSMFAYCTDALHLSEAEAYLRIAAARASREHPMLLAMLADGRLHLSGIALLAPHLTRDNQGSVLARAACKSKRQILELVAELCAASGRACGDPQAAGRAYVPVLDHGRPSGRSAQRAWTAVRTEPPTHATRLRKPWCGYDAGPGSGAGDSSRCRWAATRCSSRPALRSARSSCACRP